MKIIEIKEEFKIPGTGFTIEAGDRIKIKERQEPLTVQEIYDTVKRDYFGSIDIFIGDYEDPVIDTAGKLEDFELEGNMLYWSFKNAGGNIDDFNIVSTELTPKNVEVNLINDVRIRFFR